MLKGKLKLPHKARRVFPDRLGSLVSALDYMEDDDGNGVLDPVFESGEELEILQPNGAGLVKENEYEFQVEYDVETEKTMEKEEDKVRKKFNDKDGQGQVSVMKSIAADEKRSDLEHELSQDEINLEKLKRIASTGIPQGGGLRPTSWKLLLGYLPPSRSLWEKELTQNRQKYAKLKEELLSTPSELNKSNDDALSSGEVNAQSDFSGPLKRHEISHEDHPLSVGKASPWHQYFQHTEIADQIDRDLQRTHPDLNFFSANTSFSNKNRDAMRNILLLFAKLNPAIRYVQGMNEVLAPIFYVFTTDPDEQNAANAEADSFSCFVRLLSDSVDHFCQQLDKSPVGILSTLDRLTDLLKANDEELWRHLEFTTKDMLLRICCAMLLCMRSRLLSGDFADNLRLLQHYPEIDIDHLIQVARDLSPET
ncbi:TBC domain-containing protein C1952.17c-like isoform X2 [Euphorbia lathyris]|uniref:TBC domain-containing protein C1952.17c-like isoform X2 n=1 Tax=Euphorbia lathyris TaxID=212925 RepID=UPI0033135163